MGDVSRYQLHHGDCLQILPTIESQRVHAVITDPPYHLAPRRSRGAHKASDKPTSPQARSRVGDAGFMGKSWDGGAIAFRSEVWREMYRVMKPGAHLLAFGSPRTSHRMVCAIEDAGFEIVDTLLWIYATGMPKSKNLRGDHEGKGTALKPSYEPITLARRPLKHNVLRNVLEFEGCGALNLAACEFASDHAPIRRGGSGTTWRTIHEGEGRTPNRRGTEPSGNRRYTESGANDFAVLPGRRNIGLRGRWPANVLHDGSAAVEVALRALGSGPSAAKYFYCPKANRTDRNEGCEELEAGPLHWSSGTQSPGTFQSPNTLRAARNHHPTVKPTELMRYLCKLIAPDNGIVLDPFAGSGSTGKAAMLEGRRFVGIEREADYVAIARRRIEFARRIGYQTEFPGLAA